MGYVFGILIIIVGAFMVIKTEWFVSSFGYSGWAEEKLGGGGTRTMYKLLGIAAILLSLMGMTGMLGEVIIKVFGRMFVIS
ncbi:MAG: hypothetical protein COX80_00505 [Candidatus Magasanikbacteria bacterium CG_4_10_14_0_2_um_filter_33_14]|uniref:DUF3784 domain-containing protein n=1 Tax=Candidatus Magasanikbacteria bacterium CG_4_10_14_0_2_um_filter_33_14 TaxID=1974636 RepID=A0A2M7VBX1_9BACT|nr:MAG: hypothetical protein COX80_00505 [Candidatus Magasanikbacteria bacterium CG_4_10_14_0_2_um_filter_33_14]